MKIVLILFLAAAPFLVNAQQFADGSNLTQEIDIGVIEKLGDTIPLDLTFFNEKNEQVSLRQLIDKPTIMCFFKSDNLCHCELT